MNLDKYILVVRWHGRQKTWRAYRNVPHGREDCASSNRQLDRQSLVIERNSLDHVIKKGIIADSVGLTVIC
jgi:hypothetical protein